MFNIDKRKYFRDLTTNELIEALKKFPEGTHISVCGGNGCYIHVDEDEGELTGITLDYSALDEEYDVDTDG